MTILKSIFSGIFIGLFLALIFAFGFFLRDFAEVSYGNVFMPSSVDTGKYELLDEVQFILNQAYLRPQPSYTELQYGAIRGLLSTLNDKNTFFIDPPVAQSESQVLAGTYGGIGVMVRRDEKGQVLVYPFEGSPALKAGILDGDILIAVNGIQLTLSNTQDQIDQLLRGEVKTGNGVALVLNRGDKALELFVEFAVINIPSVMWRVLPDTDLIGYIQIVRFTNRTPSELEQAIIELTELKVEKFVLDLRNNSGGLLSEAITVASYFLQDGLVAYEASKDFEKEYTTRDVAVSITEYPLVVLVNGRTASASELVAGAIQDRERGTLIGQSTYGKGTVQQIFSLSDGSSVHITSAEWLTPNKQSLEGKGLTPDIQMIIDINGRDIELSEAIRILNE